VFYNLIGVRASLTAMTGLVVLIEGVWAPEDLVAVRAGELLPPFMKFFLMALPVKLASESLIAWSTPVALVFCAVSILFFWGQESVKGSGVPIRCLRLSNIGG
jgi:hypothetical protein